MSNVINELNRNAINSFIHSPMDHILFIGKDNQGREYLEIREKSCWAWILALFCDNYKLSTVVNYLQKIPLPDGYIDTP